MYPFEFGWASNLGTDRGKILEAFSRLEFLVNELIQTMITAGHESRAQLLDNLLEAVDFFSRLRFLYENDVITKDVYQLANETKQVRNGLAHRWSVKEINYKGKKLQSNIKQFEKDFITLSRHLIDAYDKQQNQFDFEKIIESLSKSK
jgi:hypothetical protein